MVKSAGQMTHRVSITVNKNGDFSYVNPLIWANPGDDIEWECTNNLDFAVHFGWDSPLDKGRYRASAGNRIIANVPKDARPGYYRYSVAVADGKDIWSDDPELIIRRP